MVFWLWRVWRHESCQGRNVGSSSPQGPQPHRTISPQNHTILSVVSFAFIFKRPPVLPSCRTSLSTALLTSTGISPLAKSKPPPPPHWSCNISVLLISSQCQLGAKNMSPVFWHISCGQCGHKYVPQLFKLFYKQKNNSFNVMVIIEQTQKIGGSLDAESSETDHPST